MSRQRKFLLNPGLDFTEVWKFSRCPSVFGCGSLQSCKGAGANSLITMNLLPASSGLSAQRLRCCGLVVPIIVCNSLRCMLWSIPVIAVGHCVPALLYRILFMVVRSWWLPMNAGILVVCFPWVFCGSEVFPELMLLSEVL